MNPGKNRSWPAGSVLRTETMSGSPETSSLICSPTQPSSLNFQNSSTNQTREVLITDSRSWRTTFHSETGCVLHTYYSTWKELTQGTSHGNYIQAAACLPWRLWCRSSKGARTNVPVTLWVNNPGCPFHVPSLPFTLPFSVLPLKSDHMPHKFKLRDICVPPPLFT